MDRQLPATLIIRERLTEAVLLGNVSYRTGKQLDWDGATLKATNCPEADQYIRKQYRAGWEVEATV